MHVLELVIVVLFTVLAIGYHRLHGHDARQLDEIIPDIWSAYLRNLEAVLKQNIGDFERITPQERRLAERRRLQLILQWLPKLEHNLALFQALGRYLVRLSNLKPIEEWAAHDFKAAVMLRKATLCRALLAYAQLHFALLARANAIGWPLTRPAISLSLQLCNTVVGRYRTVAILALKITAVYGDHHYENLLASL